MEQQLEDETDDAEIKKIKYLIQRIDNQNREKKKLEARKNAEQEERKRNRDLIKEGKKPVYESKSVKKNRELIQQYETLKKSGNLEKYLKKKEKKKLSKDRKNNLEMSL